MKLIYFLLALVYCQQYEFGSHHSIKIPLRRLKKTLEERRALIKILSSKRQPNYLSFLSIETIDIDSYFNCEYVGTVGVGSPPQWLDVIFDTGSGNFFVNSRYCESLSCKTRAYYDNEISTGYSSTKEELVIKFGVGDVVGLICTDTVTIAGIELPNQHFAEITVENGNVFFNSHFSGLLGLGFNTLAAKGTVPVFDRIVQSESLDWNVFSFFYSLDPFEESELILGDVNRDKYIGEIHWLPVTENPRYWTVIIDDIRLGGKSLNLCKGDCQAAIDTGTTLIGGPSSMIDEIHKHFDKYCEDVYALPDIVFVLDGKEFSVPSESYVITIGDNGKDDPGVHSEDYDQCQLGLMDININTPIGPLWILGDIFLSHYYSVFDRDRLSVGLAKAKHSS